eukprot:TRINITY_DN33738_c0_g1_i1.p1 TRINITY_DN33738_c0_g1~~TRINITY_DN33738_c0_g1_i1.p1  ORF type:complete len:752 (+),score=116.56 TRINITY_DN33738_c0_g1_i1:110-2365(+)
MPYTRHPKIPAAPSVRSRSNLLAPLAAVAPPAVGNHASGHGPPASSSLHTLVPLNVPGYSRDALQDSQEQPKSQKRSSSAGPPPITKHSLRQSLAVKTRRPPSTELLPVLTRALGQGGSEDFVRAYNTFKQNVGLPIDTRLFIISGNPEGANLDVVRCALESRGFVENKWNPEGPWFDLKWGPNSAVNFGELRPMQRVNHFEHDGELSGKARLNIHLQSAPALASKATNAFCPRTFFLNSDDSIDEFSQEFKLSKSISVLKAWLQNQGGSPDPKLDIPESVARVALAVVQRRLENIDDGLDQDANMAEQLGFEVSNSEWQELEKVQLRGFEMPAASSAPAARTSIRRVRKSASDAQGAGEVVTPKPVASFWLSGEWKRNTGEGNVVVQRRGDYLYFDDPSLGRIRCWAFGMEHGGLVHYQGHTGSLMNKVISWSDGCTWTKIAEEKVPAGAHFKELVMEALQGWDEDPQSNLCGRNIWIVKPTGLARGDGIFVSDNLEEIQQHAQQRKHKMDASVVVQKYIENPLLIGGTRKHDIRQWVLVTSANPLTIWFFNECYVRVAANDYSLEDLQDTFTHLTHTVIMKNHPNFDPDDENWRCQWDTETYRRLLAQSFGSDVWAERVNPAMKEIVIASLKCVQEAFAEPESSSCSFQLFGYDFMVDSDLSVWLLEVNKTPMMHGSGPVTERLCDACLQDVIDLALHEDFDRQAPTPGFELIYRGAKINKVKAAGSLLAVSGTQLQRHTSLVSRTLAA